MSLQSPFEGRYVLRGRYRHTVRSGLITTIAAHTATAGHLYSFRWDPATTTMVCYLRYVGIRFMCTTAYGTAQETGFSMYTSRDYTVNHTGGTAVDCGTTVVSTGEWR